MQRCTDNSILHNTVYSSKKGNDLSVRKKRINKQEFTQATRQCLSLGSCQKARACVKAVYFER